MRLFYGKLTVLLLLSTGLLYAYQQTLTLDDLVRDSDRIIRGRVEKLTVRTGVNEYGDNLIYTDVSLKTDDSLKGPGGNFILTTEGGQLNDVGLAVSDSPRFRQGEQVVVFAKTAGTKNIPAGGLQSRFTIMSDGYVPEMNMRYGEFKSRILDSIRRGGIKK